MDSDTAVLFVCFLLLPLIQGVKNIFYELQPFLYKVPFSEACFLFFIFFFIMTKKMKSCRGQFCLHLRTSDDTYYVAGKFSLTRTVELEITFLVIALKAFDLFMFKCVFPLNTHFTVRKVFHHRLKNMSMTEKVRSSVCTDNIFIEHRNHAVFLCWSFRPMFFIIKKIIIGGVRKDETQAGRLNS